MKKLISSFLALAMVLALFSGVAVFNAAADGNVEMHFPFINQYSLAEAQQMSGYNDWWTKEGLNGTDPVFSKDDQGRTVLTETTGVTADWGSYYFYWATSTRANPWTKNAIIGGINIFGDAEVSNKSAIAIKFGGDEAFWREFKKCNITFCSSQIQTSITIKDPTRVGDYYYYSFANAVPSSSYDKLGSIANAYDGIIDQLNFQMAFKNPGVRVSVWVEDIYVVGNADTLELHRAIRESKAAGVTASLIEAAEAVYQNTASSQADIDAQVAILDAALSVDKSALIDLIAKTAKLDTEGAYAAELNAARAVVDSATATQDDVDAQVAILQPIYDALLAAVPPYDRGFTYTQLPGIQDWTDDMLAQYNEQAALKGNGYTGTHAEFATDHVKGNATKSLKLIMSSDPTPNAWTVCFSTIGDYANKENASQIGNVYGNYTLLKDIFQFDGIRIAVENANGDEPSLDTWDGSSSQSVQFRFVGGIAKSWTNGALPYMTAKEYYRCADDPSLTDSVIYYDGYYYFYFKDLISGWGGNAYEKYNTSNYKNWKFTNLYFHLATGGINNPNYNGGAIYISDMQFFSTPPEPTTDNLKEIVAKANALDAFGIYYDLISEASVIADNAASTAAQIQPIMLDLLDIISELEASGNEAREELDSIIEIADNLGMFTDSNPYYDALVLADQTLSNYSTTYAELAKQINIVRGILSKYEFFSDDLTPLMVGFYDAWRYNYTPASYAAYARAVNAVWADPENVDEEAAIAAIAPAAAALEKVRITESDESWFANWTTQQVNEVVTLNPEKLCDSIGNGLNAEGVNNNGDFSRNTTFTAGGGAFSMTANADFLKKSIGWKNMDRSGNGPTGRNNDAYPVLNFTSIKQYGGLRMKIDVTGGSAERLLIGISNCRDKTKEDYALFIKPEYVADDGYINIPFSYFEKASWASNKFSQDELDDVIVFIVEAYNVTNGTTVTVSDVHAYTQILVDENKAELFALLNNAVSLDKAGRYFNATSFANGVLYNDAATEEEITDAEALMRAVIDSASWQGEEGHYYESVSLPFFQEWADTESNAHNAFNDRSRIAVSTGKACLVGDAIQSVSAEAFDGDSAVIVTNANAGGALIGGDPFEGYGTDFDFYEGMRFAITDPYGLSPELPDDAQFTFTLASENAGDPTFTATYSLAELDRDPDFFYVRFADMAASEDGVNDFGGIDADQQEEYKEFTISLTGTGIAAGKQLYFSDVQFFAKYDVLPRDELIALIEGIKALDTEGMFAADVEDAEELRDNIRAKQDELDEMTEWLAEIYEALVELYDDPEVSIDDGAEFDSCDGAVSAEWTPEEATATLNGEEYIAGTEITEVGEYVLVVTNGPKSVTVNFTIAAHVHNWSEWKVTKEATCTEAGEESRICGKCGETETRATEALGHDYVPAVTEPTCTEGGFTTYTCSRCGDSYVADETDPLGHDWGEWAVTKEATCTEAGEETRTCARCGEVETRVTEALGHDYDAFVTEPTCTEGGHTTYTCSRCGDSYDADETDPLGHDWGEWVVTKEATATEEGEETRTCARCGEVETRAIPVIVPEQKPGDMDGDDTITVADALAALRIAAKLVEETPEAVAIGDVDGDGHVTVADALAILRVAAKLADENSLIPPHTAK